MEINKQPHIWFLKTFEKVAVEKNKGEEIKTKLVFWHFPAKTKKIQMGEKKSIIWGLCEHTNWQAGEWVTEGTCKVNNILSAGRNYLYINYSPSGKELEHLPTPQWS